VSGTSDTPPNTASVGKASESLDGLFSKPGRVSIAILAGAIDNVMGDGSAPRFIFRSNGEISYRALECLIHGRHGVRGE
jgi:hypothetical protein